MKLKVGKKELLHLLSKTQNIVEKRNTMPILVNVLLEATGDKLKIFATDLEVSLTDEISVEVFEEGKVAVSAKNLFDIIKELPEGDIDLNKKENQWLEIKQNRSVFNIVGISAEEYPVFPSYSTDQFVKVDAKTLSDMIAKTIYSVSNDETRYHLNGVYFEKVQGGSAPAYRMVATDGHRLSMVDRAVDSQELAAHPSLQGVIIPRKGLHEIGKLIDQVDGDVEIAFEGPQLIMKAGSTVLMVRLIEGKYPNYQKLIPQKLPKTIALPRETFISSLKRVSLLSNQKSKGVTLNLSSGRMEISSNNPELGDAKEEIEIQYNGDAMKIGFNARYILDVLGTIQEDIVQLELDGQLSPGLIRPQGDANYTCVVMPMRI